MVKKVENFTASFPEGDWPVVGDNPSFQPGTEIIQIPVSDLGKVIDLDAGNPNINNVRTRNRRLISMTLDHPDIANRTRQGLTGLGQLFEKIRHGRTKATCIIGIGSITLLTGALAYELIAREGQDILDAKTLVNKLFPPEKGHKK